MLCSEILIKKRDNLPLNEAEIKFLVNGIISKKVSEPQSAAFLMASCIHGLDFEETGYLTKYMAQSGKTYDFSKFGRPVVDKHSTGGVGDKVSLLLVPIVASCGVTVPMISGRGLGHTGGTVDKLESIFGFKTILTDNQLTNLIEKNSCFIAGQSKMLAPADGILYKLRDVTGTVESLGLITSSILSKKFAEGLNGLVMDIKVGNGAFMKDFDSAKHLAEMMLNVAKNIDLKMRVIFSSMAQPLGNKIGNWLEIEETIDSLSGKFPKDLMNVTLRNAASMLVLANKAMIIEEGIQIAEDKISNGEALTQFKNIIFLQGGDINQSYNYYKNTPKKSVDAKSSGVVSEINTRNIGLSSILLGAGRKSEKDRIDHSAGIIFHKKLGDFVSIGETICEIISSDPNKFTDAENLILNSVRISEDKDISVPDLIIDEWQN